VQPTPSCGFTYHSLQLSVAVAAAAVDADVAFEHVVVMKRKVAALCQSL